MEQQLVTLLNQTFDSQEEPRQQAEAQLKQLYSNEQFPTALSTIAAAHDGVPVNIRQSALLLLKKFVEHEWSDELDDYDGTTIISDVTKAQVRGHLLDIALSDVQDRKVKSAASLVISKVALADFPEHWPDLLPNLIQLLPVATDGQLHGALKVLQDLVDDCLNEDEFFKVARELNAALYNIASDDSKKPIRRALAVSVFRSSFDTLEMVVEQHKTAVKGFAEETLHPWNTFFLATIKAPLPPVPAYQHDVANAEQPETYRGFVALKLQVAKVLMRIKSVFPAVLSAQSPVLFSAVWDELSTLQQSYCDFYIDDTRQGRLEDADGLPYTLDYLVLEELDFVQACLRAPPVKKELEAQLKAGSSWVQQIIQLAVTFAQITTEEESLWEIDVNVFLSEESSITANYTARTACGELIPKLGEWLQQATLEGLYSHARSVFSTESSWKLKEATLFILGCLLRDLQEVDKTIPSPAAHGLLEFVVQATQHEDDLLRARGQATAGILVKTAGTALLDVAPSLLQNCLKAMSTDESDIVKVSCVRALQQYLSAIPPESTQPLQSTIIDSLSHFLSQQDINDLNENEDVMIALLETLRDAIILDTRICLTGSGLDLLFTVASHGAENFQLAMIVTETFEEVASTLSGTGLEAFAELCGKVLPSLTGAFDVASMTEQNALTSLAAELLTVLTENGSTPLPQGYVAATMPKLQGILMYSSDDDLIRSTTLATKSMLEHDPAQMLGWHDKDGKPGVEVLLIIIDRLLGPEIDDNAGAEVGGLAAALVQKAAPETLGQYLGQLLQAVAMRLNVAEKAQIIQSLIFVFAKLTIVSPQEVVDFLAGFQIGSASGLQVVVSKWLENSVNFAGYEEIRQNVIALTKLYDLPGAFLPSIQVKGDLIAQQSSRIITRSRAKQMPTQYTTITADLKIIKLLTDELLVPKTRKDAQATAAATSGDGAGVDAEDDDGADEGWEDDEDDDFLDLGSGVTKEQLMAYGMQGKDFDGARGIEDDETQGYLVQWFKEVVKRPGFETLYDGLTDGQKEHLRVALGP